MNWYIIVLAALFLLLGSVAVYHEMRSLPEGLSYTGEVHYLQEEDVTFLLDRTYMQDGEQVREHEIIDYVTDTIRDAEEYVLADLFLFNPYGAQEHHRPLTQEVTQALLDTQADAYLVTDPINTVYDGLRAPHIETLRNSDVHVTITDHNALRDANLLYVPIYRTFFSWTGNNPDRGWLPNVFGEEKITLRSYWHLLTFRANHRKVVVADSEDDVVTIISTGNPHDASSHHTNMAVAIKGPLAHDVWRTERPLADIPPPPQSTTRPPSDITAQLVTEGAIKQALLRELNNTTRGDTVQVGAFYLSEKHVIQALIDAHERGVTVHVILDPNKDSFGIEKDGVPNKQSARKLARAGVTVRWFDTHGEQFHTKMVAIHKQDGTSVLIIGSANFTRRNLDDYNLETNAVARSCISVANSSTRLLSQL